MTDGQNIKLIYEGPTNPTEQKKKVRFSNYVKKREQETILKHARGERK